MNKMETYSEYTDVINNVENSPAVKDGRNNINENSRRKMEGECEKEKKNKDVVTTTKMKTP